MFPKLETVSTSSIFSMYASATGSFMLFQTMANSLIPSPIRNYIYAKVLSLLFTNSQELTLVFEQYVEESLSMFGRNEVYNAAESYLSTKITPNTNTEKLKVVKTSNMEKMSFELDKGQHIIDVYEGIKLKWIYACEKPEKNDLSSIFNMRSSERAKKSLQLIFDKKHRDFVFDKYLTFILERYQEILKSKRVLRMLTLKIQEDSKHGIAFWDSIPLRHPATFETLAMENDLKTSILDDLNMFLRRKAYYKKVGKAWKRGYLLYGPPGTGKSSLVAAMANYLKFNVYDLQLSHIKSDGDLRRLLLATGNKSILVIEDIDCCVRLGMADRENIVNDEGKEKDAGQLTLSGLLNFIDGLWSSCGDERIVIFTTNHKEKLDPALLRPGRMDMHIHMSYIKAQGFRTLAYNYLDVEEHPLLGEIEELLENIEITPAQVAEELMKIEDVDMALQGIVNVLKRKREEGEEESDQDGKRMKIELK